MHSIQRVAWRSWLIGLVLLIAVTGAVTPARTPAQAATPASPVADGAAVLDADSEVTVDFPIGLEITAVLEWAAAFGDADIELLYSVAGDETATLVFVTPGETAAGEMGVAATLDLRAQFVPMGVAIEFWWRVVDDGVTMAESVPEETHWYDTRWEWEEQRTEQVRVHSYAHDEQFVQEILDLAQGTVTELERRFGLDRSAPLDIWVYPSNEDFQGAQQPNTRESIAGASYPGYFVIVAAVPDGSRAEIGRVVLHEVSHQVLYQATENPFTYPPLWFDEGVATHFQIGGTDGYLEMVVRAYEDDALFSLSSLDVSFPYLPSQATLAYATSWSVVQYIEVTYGDEGISSLIDAFATGVPYDEAIYEALGVDGDGLDDAWRAWVADQAA